VLLTVEVVDDAASSYIWFRKNGYTTGTALVEIQTQVANIAVYTNAFVPCDANRVIEYRAKNTVFSDINITIMGWIF
jgi:hypothetical protein